MRTRRATSACDNPKRANRKDRAFAKSKLLSKCVRESHNIEFSSVGLASVYAIFCHEALRPDVMRQGYSGEGLK